MNAEGEVSRLIRVLEGKLARRRHLNQPEVRKARISLSPPPTSIALTFEQAEAVIGALRDKAIDR